MKGEVMPKKEVRRSPENSLRTPTKGDYIIAAHPVLTAAVVAAFVFITPAILSMIARAICGY